MNCPYFILFNDTEKIILLDTEKNLSESSCFFDKNFQFLSKKQLPSKKIFRTPFNHSEKQFKKISIVFNKRLSLWLIFNQFIVFIFLKTIKI